MADTMKCPDCGRMIPAGAAKCPHCGYVMQKSALARLLRAAADLLGGDDAGAAAVAQDLVRIERSAKIVKSDVAKRLIYAVVYEPNVDDAHGDSASPAEIEKACHGFMMKYARMLAQTGLEHSADLGPQQLAVVECYIAPVDFPLGNQRITKGSWVLVTKALADEIWAGVQDGTYTGYSFEGYGRRVPAGA